MSIVGVVYNFWAAAIIYTFQRMMFDKRYRHWLQYFQIPVKRTVYDVKIVGYSKEKLAKFWNFSSKLQSFVLKAVFFQSMFVMSLCATSALIVLYRTYNGKFYTPVMLWSLLLVSSPLCILSQNYLTRAITKEVTLRSFSNFSNSSRATTSHWF